MPKRTGLLQLPPKTTPEFMAAPTDSLLHRYLASLSHPAFIISVTNPQHSPILWANKSFSTLVLSDFKDRALEEFVYHEPNITGWLEAVSRHDPSKDLLVTFWTRSKGEGECIDVDCTAVVVDTGIIVTGKVLENSRRTARLDALNMGLDGEEESTEKLEQNAQAQAVNLNQQSSAHLPIPDPLHDDEKLARIKEYLSGGGVTGEIILNYDWESTVLGPMTTWPQSLLTCLSVVLTSSFPMLIWWGPQMIILYNDAYISLIGGKHPKMIGMEGQKAWIEIWDVIGPMLNGVLDGVATWSEESLLIMKRFDFKEETYFTWSYSPIRQEDGSVGGIMTPVMECTLRVIAERRLNTLRNLGSRTAGAKTYDEVCKRTADVLSENNADITFALIYMKEESEGKVIEGGGGVGVAWAKGKNEEPEWEEEEKVRKRGQVKLVLKECVGIDRKHPAAPEVYISTILDKFANPTDPDRSQSHSRTTSISSANSTHQSNTWPFSAVLSSCSIVNISDAYLLFSEPLPGGGWDENTRHAIACPIVATETGVVGVLILGCNPLRPMDENYKTFIELLSRQLSSSITAVRAYEEERDRAEALAAIDRAKTNFFSSVSHELRTPISLIVGPLEDALSDSQTPLPSIHHSRLTLVERNAIRLLKLVNSLLDFSRIEAGRMRARYQLTGLERLTVDLASVFRATMEKGGLEFNVDCDEGEEKVWVDRDMWEKVVYNLLGNAFKFTLHGYVHVRVHPSADRTGVEFSVEDTGTGIPSHELSKVFERFHVVEGQTSRSHEGTGIGLALTFELVSLHGGKLGVRSNLGEGSTFTVFIPYGNSHLPQERLSEVSDDSDDNPVPSVDCNNTVSSHSLGSTYVNEALSWLPVSESDLIPPRNHLLTENSMPQSIATSRVLLADDNGDMRRYVQSLLSQFWTVQTVENGEQALQAAVENPPDLIISDVMMPRLDGFALIAKLKKRKETKRIPVILLSARAGEEARVDGLRAGADDYLIKPFSAKELVARVRTHLELGLLRRELEKRVEERTKELTESETRYRTLAKLSPVGIFRTNKEGKMTYINDRWWEFLRHDRSTDPTGDIWHESVHPEDYEIVRDGWRRAFIEQEPVKIEFRSKQHPNTQEKWFLGQIIVDYDENNVMRGLIGALTDITERKQLEREKMEAMQMAEQQQRRRAEEAEEVRRQQELFIDMTCHELRNPLNGIYNNVDLIRGSLERIRLEMQKLHGMFSIEGSLLSKLETIPRQKRLTTAVREVTEWLVREIEIDLEAIDTIFLCAKHQKVIADDVLHMSRLNLNLLVIAQVDFQPQVEVANVLRVFETEAKTKRIELKLVVEDGFKRMGVNWVRGDPTRLAQVIINLLTNAIRFTEKAPVRCITVALDVGEFDSTDSNSKLETEAGGNPMIPLPLPSSGSDSFLLTEPARHHPSESTSPPPPHALLPPTTSSVFIHVSISDTGMGMTPAEQTQLFRRFAQASHITYSEFGGSGLGLYISKRLVELQGGCITVSSQKDGGTTFKFMVRCERSHGPEQKPEVLEKAAMHEKSPNLGSLLGNPIQHSTPELHRELNDKDKRTALNKQSRSPWKITNVENGEILIVEDNVVNQKVLCRQLELEGFHCTIANHGKAALEELEASISTNSSGEQRIKYDLILMDIEMPVMSGLEAAVHIREWERNGRLPSGHIPIIAVTGNARQEHAEKALTAGMDDTIIKPYIRNDLLDKIAMHTSRKTGMSVD